MRHDRAAPDVGAVWTHPVLASAGEVPGRLPSARRVRIMRPDAIRCVVVRSERVALGWGVLVLGGWTEVGQVLHTAMSQATTPPVFFESFEVPVTTNFTVFRPGQSFTMQRNAWQVTAANVDLVKTTVRRETLAGDGMQGVDLAGSPGAGAMSTPFPTTPEQRYTLSFRYGLNSGLGVVAARARGGEAV